MDPDVHFKKPVLRYMDPVYRKSSMCNTLLCLRTRWNPTNGDVQLIEDHGKSAEELQSVPEPFVTMTYHMYLHFLDALKEWLETGLYDNENQTIQVREDPYDSASYQIYSRHAEFRGSKGSTEFVGHIVRTPKENLEIFAREALSGSGHQYPLYLCPRPVVEFAEA